MDRAHRELAALVDRLVLPAEAAPRLVALLEILTTDPAAPTTIRDPVAAVRDHLADSLVALDLPEVRAATRIADLGAGAGLPGLPLAIALPHAHVALVESNGRKCDFLRYAAEACRLTNAEPVWARAEEWTDGRAACDLVTARALAALPVVAEYAAPLLALGGALVAWRGRRDPADEQHGRQAADELGLEVRDPIAVTPYPGAQYRHLHVMVKVRPTSERFPRRAGMASKRPLGGAPSDRIGR